MIKFSPGNSESATDCATAFPVSDVSSAESVWRSGRVVKCGGLENR
jgi:hypothetical protein